MALVTALTTASRLFAFLHYVYVPYILPCVNFFFLVSGAFQRNRLLAISDAWT
jgi:hypothetical protein